ncbi:MAG TPA: protein kinase, partial [Thermoanaerobaculia bacterium]
MNITDPLVLRNDVVLVPVAELPPDVRAKIDFDDGDYTVSRMHGRMPSQIIDPETASLLQLFREPTTIVEAVIRNSRALAKDPQIWLDELLPHIGGFLRSGVLVPNEERAVHEMKPQLDAGSFVDGWQVVRCVNLIEDSEIHRVRKGNVDGALKIARQPGPFEGSVFDNEAAVLTHLAGRATAPRLLAQGMHNERPYLVIEWCDGTDSGAATQYARHDRAALLAICVTIADAYAALHDANVIHADVHPRNILIDNTRVRLIDFGLSRVVDSSRTLMPRGGMYYFFEPEYLASLYGPRQLPATHAGEQYALAALLYLILTGKHYLEFRFDREEMMRQSREDAPLPFSARGVAPWPEVEAILQRALSKDPSARFPDLRTFANALRGARYEVPDVSTALIDEELATLDYPIAPFASVNYGGAGAALGVLHIAEARGDAKLLALAEVWQTRGAQFIDDRNGWYNDDEDIPEAMIGKVSPYHTVSGLHAVAALIAYARADTTAQRRAARAFVAASSQASEQIDLTLGRCGTLLAAALLFERGSDEVRALGFETLRDVWTKLDALPPIANQPRETYLGTAHGWSGYLYATLRWCAATSSPLPVEFIARLEQLATMRVARGRGAWWPRTVGGTSQDMMAGWCNGAAGHVFTFTAAFDLMRDARWLDVAREA